MYFDFGQTLAMKRSICTVVSFLLFSLALVSATDSSFDDLEPVTKDNVALEGKFKQLWDLYLLPKLENSLTTNDIESVSRDSQEDAEIAGLPLFQLTQLPRYIQRTRMKRGRGIAGLDNMDILLKTMDRNRQRNMMSVSGMTNNRLRNLMSLQGKRRK